jgi:hypothetical protein
MGRLVLREILEQIDTRRSLQATVACVSSSTISDVAERNIVA